MVLVVGSHGGSLGRAYYTAAGRVLLAATTYDPITHTFWQVSQSGRTLGVDQRPPTKVDYDFLLKQWRVDTKEMACRLLAGTFPDLDPDQMTEIVQNHFHPPADTPSAASNPSEGDD